MNWLAIVRAPVTKPPGLSRRSTTNFVTPRSRAAAQGVLELARGVVRDAGDPDVLHRAVRQLARLDLALDDHVADDRQVQRLAVAVDRERDRRALRAADPGDRLVERLAVDGSPVDGGHDVAGQQPGPLRR